MSYRPVDLSAAAQRAVETLHPELRQHYAPPMPSRRAWGPLDPLEAHWEGRPPELAPFHCPCGGYWFVRRNFEAHGCSHRIAGTLTPN